MGFSTRVIFKPFFSSSSWISSSCSCKSLTWSFSVLFLDCKYRLIFLLCFTSPLNGLVHLISFYVLYKVLETLVTWSSQISFIFSNCNFWTLCFLASLFKTDISSLSSFNYTLRTSISVFSMIFSLPFFFLMTKSSFAGDERSMMLGGGLKVSVTFWDSLFNWCQ